MAKVHNFNAGLARKGKSATEIKTIMDAACRDTSLGLTLIYYIIKKVKAGKTTDHQWHLTAKITKRTVKEDRCANCRDLAFAHGVSNDTMHNILRNDLGLVKKSQGGCPSFSARTRNRECLNLQGVHHRRPVPLHGNVGLHHNQGQDNGVLPHTRD